MCKGISGCAQEVKISYVKWPCQKKKSCSSVQSFDVCSENENEPFLPLCSNRHHCKAGTSVFQGLASQMFDGTAELRGHLSDTATDTLQVSLYTQISSTHTHTHSKHHLPLCKQEVSFVQGVSHHMNIIVLWYQHFL